MSEHVHPLPAPASADPVGRLLEATALLEAIAGGRVVLDGLTDEQRRRLITAAGDVFCPDVSERRLRTKARQ